MCVAMAEFAQEGLNDADYPNWRDPVYLTRETMSGGGPQGPKEDMAEMDANRPRRAGLTHRGRFCTVVL